MILQNILCLVLQIFLYLEAFDDKNFIRFSQLEVVLHSNQQSFVEKDKECSSGWLVNTDPEY